MKLHRCLTAVLIFLIGIWILPTKTTTAYVSRERVNGLLLQSAPVTYSGLNLLFIIDQSGSMGGTRYGGELQYGSGSDTNDLRFYGPDYAFDWLKSFVASQPDSDMPTINMGLLAFGTTPRLLLNWTQVYKGYTAAEWEAIEKQVNEALSNERFRDKDGNFTNLGYTDFRQAFAEAKQLFQAAPRPPAGETYLSAIVVLTDGAPCSLNFIESCNDFSSIGFPATHLFSLREEVQRNFPDYELFLVNFDADRLYWNQLEDDWNAVICPPTRTCNPLAIKQVEIDRDISGHFNAVLTDLIWKLNPGSVSRTTVAFPAGTFEVAPYSQFLRVNFFKSTSDPLGSVVQLIQPSPDHSKPVTEIQVNTPIEIREVLLPYPGTWKVAVSDMSKIQTVNVVADLIKAAGQLSINGVENSRSGMLSLTTYQPAQLVLKIVDGGGNVLELYPNNQYALTVVAHIYDATDLDPSRRTLLEDVTLTLDEVNAPNRNQFLGNWKPAKAGFYEVRVDASYTDDAGNPVSLLQNKIVYDRFYVEPVYFEKLGPAASSERVGTALPFRTVLRHQTTHQPVTWSTADLVTEVTLLNLDGTPALPPQVIPNSSSGSSGEVTGEIIFDTDGQYQVQMQVGVLDSSGVFVPLDETPGVFSLTLRPVHPLVVSVKLHPSRETVDAYETGLHGDAPFFWSNAPLRIQVELVNTLTGQPVSVRELMTPSGEPALPGLIVTSGDDKIDLTSQLRETTSGIYILSTEAIGTGDYTFTASVNVPAESLLSQDFTWQQQSARIRQNRQFNSGILLAGLGIVVGIVVMGVALEIGRRRLKYLRAFPMRGTVTAYRLPIAAQDPEMERTEVRDFNLSSYNRNRKVLKGKDAKPFQQIIFSAPRDEQQHKRNILVEGIKIKQKGKVVLLESQITLKAGGERKQAYKFPNGDRYMLEYLSQPGKSPPPEDEQQSGNSLVGY